MELILNTLIIVSLIFFSALFVFSLVIFAVHHRTGGALFVPTPRPMLAALMKAVDFSRFRDIRDLGCGDGRFISAVEKTYGSTVIGYEINPIAFVVTWLRIRVLGLGSSVRYADFWNRDLSGADCIYCYLFPDVLARLSEKLDQELRDGTRVISANFPLPGWREEGILRAQDTIFDDPIYVYCKGSHT
ncbi:MAG: hypothetical protein LLG43_03660 [Deltaproteobacteria bacterium]|nr:hypothetical protein [Deltaproteobacteria bacterium]